MMLHRGNMDHTAALMFLSLCSSGLWAERTTVTFEIRLEGGTSRCHGNLQVKDQGDWMEVQDRKLAWDLTSAAEVCRQLDCGSVVSIWRDYHVMKISCSDSVRLVDGTNWCSGRLEVNLNQSWSSVAEDAFDQQDAEVVCRELGCGPPSVLQGALYGETEAPAWSQEFQCEGNETSLLDCDGSDRIYSGKAAGLTCSEPDDWIRLVGGNSRCSGELEMKHRDEWKVVGGYFKSMTFSDEVCKHLNCGASISTTRGGFTSATAAWSLGPYCDESSLRTCVKRITSSYDSTMITCSDSVRLVDGTNWCSGRLEVNLNQSWSSVAEDAFDQQDAEVVCRELGCGPPSVLQGALYGETEAPAWSKEFQCEGNETSLLDCDGSDRIYSGKAAGLTCSVNIRLMGETSRCAGKLEMFKQKWKPVSDWCGDWNQSSGAVVCAHMGCGSVVSTRKLKESSEIPRWWTRPYCLQLDSLPRVCFYQDDYKSDHTLEVICSDLLVEPQISLSSSTDRVSKAIKQGSGVPMGSDFSIMCSIQPQYQGGSFQLIFITSNSTQNSTLPAVNHSALFLFSAADHAHQGTYSCVYHVSVFSHHFWSRSQPLSLTVSGSWTDLIIRLVVVLLGMTGSILLLYFYFKTSSSQKSGAERKHHVDGSRAEGCREEETAFMDQ